MCPKVHPPYYATIKRALNRTKGVVIVLLRVIAADLAATVSPALSSEHLAGGEWPDGPNKAGAKAGNI